MWLWIAMSALLLPSPARDPCGQSRLLLQIARSRSLASLPDATSGSSNPYVVKLIGSSRAFQLKPGSKYYALALLKNLPRNDAQLTAWATLGDSLCDAETPQEMELLSRRGERINRDFANAVLVVPSQMGAYVNAALLAIQQPHSSFVVEMKRVCRGKNNEFSDAIRQMNAKDRSWFVTKIMDPVRCRENFLVEAD